MVSRLDEKQRPAYVQFERRGVEDRAASLAAGKYVAKDVDWVMITPVGGKDVVEKPVSEWLQNIAQQVREERMPLEFEERYRRAYEFWKRGEEIPLNGTPIKGWPVLSPAQQKTVIAANILTVEDLAVANGEAVTRMGIGGLDMKQKAESWLKASTEIGTVVMENAALKLENATLKGQVTTLEARNQELAARLPQAPRPEPVPLKEEIA